jgi:hypothetical protein
VYSIANECDLSSQMNLVGEVLERLLQTKEGERGLMLKMRNEEGGREGLTVGARDVSLCVQFSDLSYRHYLFIIENDCPQHLLYGKIHVADREHG